MLTALSFGLKNCTKARRLALSGDASPPSGAACVHHGFAARHARAARLPRWSRAAAAATVTAWGRLRLGQTTRMIPGFPTPPVRVGAFDRCAVPMTAAVMASGIPHGLLRMLHAEVRLPGSPWSSWQIQRFQEFL